MVFLGDFLRVLNVVLAAGMLAIGLFQLWLSFFGFSRQEKDYQDHDPESRFLILVPAHNEEQVIGDIVRCLQNMDYPKELYDFYVIADNCTDRTAEKARALGADVIETRRTHSDEPTGKPQALRKALASLGDYAGKYDLLMIFDADNLMDSWMLKEVNSQWVDKEHPDFIQCYLGAKNKEGVVAWCYYTGYTLTNRFFQLAKYRRGLNCSIGGTGFAISTEYLKERGGWSCVSLTEDFEIQVEATLAGKRVLWNHHARVYDEKPTSLKASIRQKIRWGQGHWYVCLHNTRAAFRALREGTIGVREWFSTMTYMYSLSVYVVALIQGLITALLYAVPSLGGHWFSEVPVLTFWGYFLFAYSYLFLFYAADWVDNAIRFSPRTLPMMVFSSLVNLVISCFNQIVGLIRCGDQKTWVKTEHTLCRKKLNVPLQPHRLSPRMERAR